jgi:hypothetical protein
MKPNIKNTLSNLVLSTGVLTIIIIIFIFCSPGCQKVEDDSYLCKGTSIVSKPGYVSDTVFNSFTKDHITADEITLLEEMNTNIITQVHDGFSYTITNKLVCAKLTCPEY